MAPTLIRRALLATTAALLAGVLAEVALCLLLPSADAFFVWPPGLQRVFRPGPGLMPGVEGDSVFRVNSLGLRGDEPLPQSTPRILCVGGSTTECLYLDQSEAWPALVQAGLGGDAWVSNAGVSGRSTRDHLVQLEHLLPQLGHLDRVVLLVGVNDLQLVLGQGEDYDPAALDAPGARRSLLPRAFEVLPPEHRDVAFPRSTCLWRFFVPRLKALRPSSQVQDAAGESYVRWRRYRASSTQVLDSLPDLGPGLAEFRDNLADLARLCRDAGARPLFLTQPFLWAQDSPPEHRSLFWMGGIGPYQKAPGASYYSCAALAEGMQRYNAALRQLCEELDADYLDLAAGVPADGAYFYDGVHFNEAGARLVADQVTATLR